MTTEKITYLQVLEKYMRYSEMFSQYNRLDEEDKKVLQPYIDHLKHEWQEELERLPKAKPISRLIP